MKKSNIAFGLITVALVFAVASCDGRPDRSDFGNKMFSKFDTDNDNFVDKTEYFAISTGRFERADDNKDDKVSQKESKNTFIAKKFPSKAEQWFNDSDINKDGYISNMEMREKSKAEFFKQDTNSNGKLSKDEMHTYRKSMRTSHE